MPTPADLGIHGTASMYISGGCSCAECWRAVQPRVKHGTWTGYFYWRCRCAECVGYNSERCKKIRSQKRSPPLAATATATATATAKRR